MESAEQIIRMNNLSKELRKYGFAQSSQEAIAQAGTIIGDGNQTVASTVSETATLTKAQANELMNKMQRLWVFKESTDQKVTVIADQLVKVTDKLNEVIKSISLVEMNQAVFDKKLNMLKESGFVPNQRQSESRSQSHQEHAEESSAREKEKKLDKPIDRNGVAPAEVTIEKMFYYGNKR